MDLATMAFCRVRVSFQQLQTAIWFLTQFYSSPLLDPDLGMTHILAVHNTTPTKKLHQTISTPLTHFFSYCRYTLCPIHPFCKVLCIFKLQLFKSLSQLWFRVSDILNFFNSLFFDQWVQHLQFLVSPSIMIVWKYWFSFLWSSVRIFV